MALMLGNTDNKNNFISFFRDYFHFKETIKTSLKFFRYTYFGDDI